MRKLIYAINLTVDGCFDHTKINPDDKLLDYWTNILRSAGVLVYGRITYELMVPYWPDVAKNRSASKADLAFADTFNDLDKVVFSRSLTKVDDIQARITSADLHEEITRLKQERGKDLLLGGVSLPSQMIGLGLVDEFIFVVHPVIAGSGPRLTEAVGYAKALRLKTVDSESFDSGVVVLRYAKS